MGNSVLSPKKYLTECPNCGSRDISPSNFADYMVCNSCECLFEKAGKSPYY